MISYIFGKRYGVAMSFSAKAASARKPLAASAKLLPGAVKRGMSAAELHHDMNAFAAQLAGDPQAAAAFLQTAGILTNKGKLAKGYR